MKNRGSKYFLLLMLLFFLPSTGCNVWYDFTTYFNLYYNASYLFEEAEISISEQRKDIYNINEPSIANNANQSLNKVIEKCSKILQFNSESSFVDDALFMTGKAFYYQKLFPRALRKFEELIAKVPDSKLIPEAELWIAKTQSELKSYELALQLLSEIKSKAVKEKNEDLLSLAFVEEIRTYKRLEKYSDALRLTSELMKLDADNLILYQTAFEIGELNQTIKNYSAAAAAYSSVNKYSPSFDYEFNSQIKFAKMLRLLNQNEDAVKVLSDLRSEEKNSQSFDAIDFEMGMAYKELGEYDNAYQKFKFIDTAFANSVNAGLARYEMGEMFEVDVFNYDSAFVYYQKAQTSTSNIEYAQKIKNKAQLFNKYRTLLGNQLSFMRQNEYLVDSTAFERDSIAFSAEQEKELEEQQSNEAAAAFGNERGNIQQNLRQNTQVKSAPQRPTVSLDSLSVLLSKNSFEMGNLFFTELFVYDSAYYYYKIVVDNYPDSKVYPEALYSLGTYYYAINDSVKGDSIYNHIYDTYKTLQIVNAVASQLNKPLIDLNFDPARDVYTRAESLLTSNDYGKSFKHFYEIHKAYPNSEYAPKSLFTSGWILEEKLTLKDSAAVVYDSLVTKFPRSVYAQKVSPKLNFYKQEKTRLENLRLDSLKKAEEEIRKIAVEDSIRKAELNKPKEVIPTPEENSDKKEIDENEEEKENPSEEEQQFSFIKSEEFRGAIVLYPIINILFC